MRNAERGPEQTNAPASIETTTTVSSSACILRMTRARHPALEIDFGGPFTRADHANALFQHQSE